ncbi:MAG: S8 family serine peptidase [Gammaproteobacteria bacterium]|nr:S8 family serine peptidase [Gammaproteobacteria bacterium]
MAVMPTGNPGAGRRLARWPLSLLVLLALGGCGGDGDSEPPPPPPPAKLSLEVTGDTQIKEADNPKVTVAVQLDTPAAEAVTAALNLAGSASHGRDYAIAVGGESAEVSDAGVLEGITVASGARSASVEIDIYRDFDDEGNETIEVSLGTITGNAEAGETSSVSLTVIDGEAHMLAKASTEGDGEVMDVMPDDALELLPFAFDVTADTIVVVVSALLPSDNPMTEPLVAELSTDRSFASDVQTFTYCYAPSTDPQANNAAGRRTDPCQAEPITADDQIGFFFAEFANVREFRLPVSDLAPNQQYFLRITLGSLPENFNFDAADREASNVVVNSFATNAQGRVALRCQPPQRTPATGGADPLFSQQWHLVNTGQTAFSDRSGSAGADMRMMGAIGAGRSGAGVKLAVVDSGLEICHPDLAANTSSSGSFNFGAAFRSGASSDDPYNFSLLGDHGTSVAGVAAAVANNGRGGRGVAPGVKLVGFNPLSGSGPGGDDTAVEIAFIKSLGGSSSAPDSASVDIFNMSYGQELPAENATTEIARVIRMGTEQLRSGRGAIYVKAPGNAFDACDQAHPFHRELGCFNSNADPDNNLPWLIAVGGFNADDRKSSYSSAGANLWIVAPSGEDGVEAPAIITTDQTGPFAGFSTFPDNRLTSNHPLNRDGDYVSAFGGTSSAAPAVAGAVALMLEVKPELTWRDIKHILASTARRIDPDIAEVRAAFNGTPYIAQHAWQTNGADYAFHNWYGFGAIDVDEALMAVNSHTPDSLGALAESQWFEAMAEQPSAAIPDADGAGVRAALNVSGLPEDANIEAVVLEVSVNHRNAIDLGITLGSPSGAQSVLNSPFNVVLDNIPGLTEWHLLSNAFYGENPNGEWSLHVADLAPSDTGTLGRWRLRFYYGDHPAN